MNSFKNFDKFTEIEDAYIKRARPGEIEDDWVEVIIDGQTYDSFYIDEIEGYGIIASVWEISFSKSSLYI